MTHRSRLFRALFAAGALAAVAATPGCAQPRGTARPEAPTGAVSFLAVGDWGRRGSLEQRRVAHAMGMTAEALGVQFVLALGDNFYPDGVRTAKDPQFFQSWENVYRDKSLQVDWYAALGNHDYFTNPQAQVEYSARNSRWKMPARYYSFTKTVSPGVTAEFIVLDTDPFILRDPADPRPLAIAPAPDTVAQRMWLDSTLEASTAQWKIVVGHHHVYTGGERVTQTELELLLVPRFEKYGVIAYLCGHEHHLEHIQPAFSTTHYFISGAGSETRTTRGTEGTKFRSSETGFFAMSLMADSMLVQAVDNSGKVIYRTKIGR